MKMITWDPGGEYYRNMERKQMSIAQAEVKELRKKEKRYTFSYMFLSNGRWGKGAWVLSPQEFPDIESAIKCSGLWMQACHSHGCPVAVKVEDK